mmetsp:Transcript_30066/g.80083  ORF Transcript_30066/g.80083 Transcript_30066/m.80083 type:complete len:331 (+) Transcript_30066:220-1212(+)
MRAPVLGEVVLEDREVHLGLVRDVQLEAHVQATVEQVRARGADGVHANRHLVRDVDVEPRQRTDLGTQAALEAQGHVRHRVVVALVDGPDLELHLVLLVRPALALGVLDVIVSHVHLDPGAHVTVRALAGLDVVGQLRGHAHLNVEVEPAQLHVELQRRLAEVLRALTRPAGPALVVIDLKGAEDGGAAETDADALYVQTGDVQAVEDVRGRADEAALAPGVQGEGHDGVLRGAAGLVVVHAHAEAAVAVQAGEAECRALVVLVRCRAHRHPVALDLRAQHLVRQAAHTVVLGGGRGGREGGSRSHKGAERHGRRGERRQSGGTPERRCS